MLTARQATPGTKVIVSGTWFPMGNTQPETVHTAITVGRWEGNGDGTATLYATTGQACGRYTEDRMFPETLAESFKDETP